MKSLISCSDQRIIQRELNLIQFFIVQLKRNQIALCLIVQLCVAFHYVMKYSLVVKNDVDYG